MTTTSPAVHAAHSVGPARRIEGTPGAVVVAPVLGLVVTLCRELAAADIGYCHWKSNEGLDRSASGENDLDLLVHRSDADRFTELLHRLGFKQVRLRPVREFPGVLHFFAVDPGTQRFVHVHAQYQLVLGDDMTKNHRLPLETAYLASAVQGPVFRTPAPELELMLLVLRLVIKHGALDARLTLQGSLESSERREVQSLLDQVDESRLWDLVHEQLPFLERQLWQRCLSWVTSARPGWDGVPVARDLHRVLAAHAKQSWPVDTPLKVFRRGVIFTRRRVLRRPPDGKRLESGGALIAVVGGAQDERAAIAEGVSTWLGSIFSTRRLTMPCEPHAQLAMYVRARRAASQGALIVCDGFPTQSAAEPGSPQAHVRHPDVAVVLGGGMATELEGVADGAGSWPRCPTVLRVAGGPADHVLAEVKRGLWASL